MEKYVWNSSPDCGRRVAALILIRGNELHRFRGETIPRIAVLTGEKHITQDQWGYVRYRLRLANGVIPWSVTKEFSSGRWSGPATWEELYRKFIRVGYTGSEEGLRQWIEKEFPDTWKRLNRIEAELAELDDKGPKKVIVGDYPATIQFIRQEAGLSDDVPVLTSVDEEAIRGKIVYGNLPLPLASVAAAVVLVEFSGEPGIEYSLEDMRRAGAHLRTYTVVRRR